MSNADYIYASSRVAALEANLLSETQVERMISAKSADEAFVALNDTFLAPYIAGRERSSLPRALRKSVSATKRLIASIAPEPALFDILWLRYDFYNLKTIIKGIKAGRSDEELREQCFYAGKYDLDTVIAAVHADDLYRIDPFLAKAFAQAQTVENVYEIDFAMNMEYFAAIRALADELTQPFVQGYVTCLIDLFNLRTQLRLLSFPTDIDRAALFVDGGSYHMRDLTTKEAILAQYGTRGDQTMWRDAIATFEDTDDYAVLEKAADDSLVHFIKNQHASIDSPIPLFGYFLAHRNNTQIVKTIMTAKESGMAEVDVRRVLRRLYV